MQPGDQQDFSSQHVCQCLQQPVNPAATLPGILLLAASLERVVCEDRTHQYIHSLHLCQSLQIPVGMVQIQRHTADFLELGAGRQLQLGVAPLQQLIVIFDAPLVVALNESHFEGAL